MSTQKRSSSSSSISNFKFILILLLIACVAQFSTDIYLPSIPAISKYFAASISASQWMDSNVESTVLDCNDLKRERRLAAYSDMISSQDVAELSSGVVNINKMEIERISVKVMYWTASDHLWEWDNSMNLTYDVRKNSTLSAVNLGMSEFSGKSSTLSLVLDSYYKNMPDFTYRLYSNDELALYWTFEY